MRKTIISALFSLVSLSIMYSQSPIGKVYFTDRSSTEFYKMDRIALTNNNTNSNSEGIYVYYQNSMRLIKYSNIDKFTVITWEKSNSPDVIYNATCEIITKTGMTVKNKITGLTGIKVRIFDELSGEMKAQTYFFAKDYKLVIKSIDLY